MSEPGFSVHDLEAIVRARLDDETAASYTRTLARKGVAHCARKVGEEAVETVVAAVEGDRAALTAESADVIFHLTVLLTLSGLSWADVMAELEGRTGQSGLQEKANRLS